jgi:hypothetical protein
MSLLDEHRAYLIEMRQLAQDEQGRDVLAGLTVEETEFYLSEMDAPGASDRWLELDNRHQRAIAEMISAENEARQAGPKH